MDESSEALSRVDGAAAPRRLQGGSARIKGCAIKCKFSVKRGHCYLTTYPPIKYLQAIIQLEFTDKTEEMVLALRKTKALFGLVLDF